MRPKRELWGGRDCVSTYCESEHVARRPRAMMMNAMATKPTPIVVDRIVMAVLQASFVPQPMIVPVAVCDQRCLPQRDVFRSGQNDTETDVDCGGPCSACSVGQQCRLSEDCHSGSCVEGVCAAAPTCANFFQTPAKPTGLWWTKLCRVWLGPGCLAHSDCATGQCIGGLCATPPLHCEDGQTGEGETGVDCGGSCAPCQDGATCVLEQDCLSQVCQLDTCIGAIDHCRLDAPFEYLMSKASPSRLQASSTNLHNGPKVCRSILQAYRR